MPKRPRRKTETESRDGVENAKTKGHIGSPKPRSEPTGRTLGTIEVAPARYTIDGSPYDRVTKIISTGVPKPFLMMWMRKVIAEEAIAEHELLGELIDTMGEEGAVKWLKEASTRQRDAAGSKGTMVHAYAENALTGEYTPEYAQYSDNVNDDPMLSGMADAAQQILDTVFPIDEWTHVEALCYSDAHGYAGTMDGIVVTSNPLVLAELGLDRPARLIVDWKSSKSVYDTFALQLAAYANAEWIVDTVSGLAMPSLPEHFDGAAVLHIRPDKWSVTLADIGPETFAAFTAAQSMKKWVERTSKTVIGKPVAAQKKVKPKAKPTAKKKTATKAKPKPKPKPKPKKKTPAETAEPIREGQAKAKKAKEKTDPKKKGPRRVGSKK